MSISVKDILKRPYFQNAKILAGKNGLHREVKWVHIVEIARFGHLLNGNEVILTTGIGWAHDEEKSISYIQQLLDFHASALCIELVVHVKHLPHKMLELADKHNFPIISFHEEVRFIDIIKDLHELLIGFHEDIWWKLEHVQQRLNNALTSNGNIGDFLRIIHQETKKQIALSYNEQFRFFPSPSSRRQVKWIRAMEQARYYSQEVSLLKDKIGELLFIEDRNTITQFDKLAMKRCSDIIAQYFWRHHQQIEVEQMDRNKWILDAMYGSLSHEEVVQKIQHDSPGTMMKKAIVGIKPYQTSLLSKDKEIHSETTSIMLLRSVLTDYGFQLFTVKDNTRSFYVLLLIYPYTDNFLSELDKALQQLKDNNDNLLIQRDLKWLSFGKVISNYSHLGKSYETAISTFTYQQNIEKLEKPFYNHLDIYRLMDLMNNKHELKEIVNDYIGPLITYDEENNTELIKTLHIYLKNLGSKNETAQDLHIVRQTLYHRLQRMEELLGKDFLDGNKRFMIEFSIHALKYIDN